MTAEEWMFHKRGELLGALEIPKEFVVSQEVYDILTLYARRCEMNLNGLDCGSQKGLLFRGIPIRTQKEDGCNQELVIRSGDRELFKVRFRTPDVNEFSKIFGFMAMSNNLRVEIKDV